MGTELVIEIAPMCLSVVLHRQAPPGKGARPARRRVAPRHALAGIAFACERMERTPNRRAAHQLIDLAQSQGRAGPVVDALFRAYFEEAQDIGDAAALAAIAAANGVSGWPGQANATGVAENEESVRRLGISAVPPLIFGRQFRGSGADPPRTPAPSIPGAPA